MSSFVKNNLLFISKGIFSSDVITNNHSTGSFELLRTWGLIIAVSVIIQLSKTPYFKKNDFVFVPVLLGHIPK